MPRWSGPRRWLKSWLALRGCNRSICRRPFWRRLFFYAANTDLDLTKWGMFFAGLFTVAQFSFWGNYLPRVYPTHLRGTGEGFAANIGGRMLGTGFAFVTTQLVNVMPGSSPQMQLAYAAAGVATFVYVAGLVCSTLLPEPKEGALPE
jgi:hypothetical protein